MAAVKLWVHQSFLPIQGAANGNVSGMTRMTAAVINLPAYGRAGRLCCHSSLIGSISCDTL